MFLKSHLANWHCVQTTCASLLLLGAFVSWYRYGTTRWAVAGVVAAMAILLIDEVWPRKES